MPLSGRSVRHTGSVRDTGQSLTGWQQRPERAAGGAVLGLVGSWILAFVVLSDRAVRTNAGLEPTMTPLTMALLMMAPILAVGAMCTVPTLRRWQGYFLPGLGAGVALGYLILATVRLLASLA